MTQFDFPQGDPSIDHIDYVTQEYSGRLGGALTVTYTITGDGVLKPNATNFPGDIGNPVAHLFFAAPDYDPYNMDIPQVTKRWWSIVTGDLTPGEHTITVAIEPANWLCVDGKHGDTELAGFQAAIAKVGFIGITFGAERGAAGHGVAAVSGSVHLVINNLEAHA